MAQTQAINGSIRGHVTDPAGASVSQASVTVVNESTGFRREILTDDGGYYVVPNLPLGAYTVTIQKAGFETERHSGIQLTAGAEAVVQAQLRVGAVSTEVEVTGGAPLIEPTRVSTGRTISNEEIENLPLTSRNPYNFIIFQPGVSGHPNAELGIPRTLNTNGLLDRINYQMDGMVDTESDRYGLRLFPISDVYVREIQTVSNSYAPEFGGTAGDIYNVVTNSGANVPHGEFYYLGRPTDLAARPLLLNAATAKPDLTLRDFAGNAGGAIIHDKLFLFGGYEHLDRGLPSPNTIAPSDAAAIGIPSNLLAVAPSIQHAQFFNVRADWNISSKHQFFVRYNYFRNNYPYNTAVGSINALDAAADFQDRAHVFGAQLLSSFSSTILNELRFGWPYRNEHHVASALTGPGPQITISGIATFNGSSSVGDRYQEKIPNLNESLTLLRNRHTIKLGGGFQQMQDTQTADIFSRYTFASIAAYLQAKSGAAPLGYTNYTSVIGLPGAWYHSLFWNWFAQDSFQVRPNLLVIFGLRYDRFQGPPADPNAPFIYSRNFRTPGKNFAPRVGFAWSISPRDVLRVSSGLFYEPSPTNLWYNAFINNGNPQAYSASLGPGSPFAPAFPNVITLQPGVVPPSADITAVTPNYRNAYTINTSVQFEHQLTHNDSLAVGYVNTGARELEFLRNLNLINPTGFLADGRPIYSTAINPATRLFPQFNNITFQDVGAITNYNALIVHYRHQFAQGFQASAAYTWSHSISDAPDVNSFEQNLFIEDNTSRQRDRGNSIVNRPQALTLSTVFHPTVKLDNRAWKWLANGNELALLGNFSSGDQQNVLANRNLNLDGLVTAVARPLFIGRDTVRGPNVYQLDARFTRTMLTIRERLQARFIAEANNLLNRENLTSLKTTATVDANGLIQTLTGPNGSILPNPSLAPSSTVLEKRIIQFGVKLDW